MLEDADSSDLYEGGRSSSKRKYSDDEGDDRDSRRSNDPNSYNASMAKCRKNLIDAEFSKRKSMASSNNEPSEEEKLLAEKTLLTDPFTQKIQGLTLKARENWFKKMQQVLQKNFDLFEYKLSSIDFEYDQTKMCIEFEFDHLKKARNLSIYQANCIKKIREIEKFTIENKFYLEEYKQSKERLNEEILVDKTSCDEIAKTGENLNSQTNNPNNVKMQGFTSALSVFNNIDNSNLKCVDAKNNLKEELKKENNDFDENTSIKTSPKREPIQDSIKIEPIVLETSNLKKESSVKSEFKLLSLPKLMNEFVCVNNDLKRENSNVKIKDGPINMLKNADVDISIKKEKVLTPKKEETVPDLNKINQNSTLTMSLKELSQIVVKE
jgi:hypothetical protein